MINIKLGEYGIKTSDKLNIVLVQYKTVQDVKSKNYGNTTEKVLGYYSTLEQALRGYTKLTENTCNANSINALLAELKAINSRIEKIGNQIKNEV